MPAFAISLPPASHFCIVPSNKGAYGRPTRLYEFIRRRRFDVPLRTRAHVEHHRGTGHADQAGPLASALVGRDAHVLLVADPGLAATGLVEEVATSLKGAGLGVSVFSEFGGDPTIASADAGAALARRTGSNAVVALGGGSALDLGKVVAAISRQGPARQGSTSRRSAGDYALGKRPLPAKRLASIVIPTTAGTGSELTRTAILTRADKAKVWLGATG